MILNATNQKLVSSSATSFLFFFVVHVCVVFFFRLFFATPFSSTKTLFFFLVFRVSFFAFVFAFSCVIFALSRVVFCLQLLCFMLLLYVLQVRLTTLNGSEILSLGQWEACKALREAFSSAESWSEGDFVTEDGGGERGREIRAGNQRRRRSNRCAVIFLDEADALLAR